MQASSPALRIRQVSKFYSKNKIALDRIDITIPEGSFYALLGPNGAGKSTLINILSDVVKASQGQITLFGKDFFKEKMWCKRRLGIVPQEVAFDPFFNVQEILKITAGLYGQQLEKKWLDELLTRLQLDEHAHKNTRQLSGGMKRRLLIAQALVHRPPFIILDEPTAGVDTDLRRQLWDFILELNKQGTTVLLTTHYLEEAQTLCDQVAILHQGQLLCEQSMEHIIGNFAQRDLIMQFEHVLPTNVENSNFHMRVDAKNLIIKLDSHTPFHEAYAQAVQLYGPPKNVEVQQENLEDIFLRMTSHE